MASPVTLMKTQAERELAVQFATTPTHMLEGRQKAFAAFTEKGLPHRRVEAWHYTDLRALMRDAQPLAKAPSGAMLAAAGKMLASQDKNVAWQVVVNGFYVPELSVSLPRGISAEVLNEGAGDLSWNDPTLSLNAAFCQSALGFDIEDGFNPETPLGILYLSLGDEACAAFSRVDVRIGKGASLTLVEAYVGGVTASQTNHILKLDVAGAAKVEHIAHVDNGAAQQIVSLVASLGEEAILDSHALVTKGDLSRRQIFLDFQGENARGSLNGVALLKGRQHADTTLVVRHQAPHCESREHFRHLLEGEATGVFQGKIIVEPGAQKTDGKMMSKAILLSETATMNNKPELEIFADDVVCGHGATVGALDEDQVFYLCSRGLPKPEAEALLLQAFAGAVLDGVVLDSQREAMQLEVDHWLKNRGMA